MYHSTPSYTIVHHRCTPCSTSGKSITGGPIRDRGDEKSPLLHHKRLYATGVHQWGGVSGGVGEAERWPILLKDWHLDENGGG